MWLEVNKVIVGDNSEEFYVRCDTCGNVIGSTKLFSTDKTRCSKCGAYHKGIRYAMHKVVVEG